MTKGLLIVTGLIDLALAALLVGVSGFIIGTGPESMKGGPLLTAAYVAAVIACVAAPVAGFILHGYGKSGLGLALAGMPPAGALVALMIPTPY